MPTVNIHAYSPDLYLIGNYVGWNNDRHLVNTARIQFNISCPSVGGAIYVDHANDGVVVATIDPGYKFIGGTSFVDPHDIFSGDLDKGGDHMKDDAILALIKITLELDQANPSTCRFVVGGFSRTQYINGRGTINVTFQFEYVDA